MSPDTNLPPATIASTPRPKKRNRIWKPIGIAAVVLFAAWTILSLTGTVKCYRMPTKGMLPTCTPGDQVFSERISYWFSDPERNEIIAFEVRDIADIGDIPPSVVFMKRIVGLPGDKLTVENDRLFINGTPSFLTPKPNPRAFPISLHSYLSSKAPEYIVPEDCYFVVGDNLENSSDSRNFGPVPEKNVKGKIWFRYWPLGRFGPID